MELRSCTQRLTRHLPLAEEKSHDETATAVVLGAPEQSEELKLVTVGAVMLAQEKISDPDAVWMQTF